MTERPRLSGLGEWLDRAAAVATLLILLVLVYRNLAPTPTPPEGAEPLYVPGETVLRYVPPAIGGRPEAPVVVAVFADFECQFCAKLASETLPQIKKEFVETGQVLLVVKNAPGVARLYARDAAASSLCAGQQGHYWLFHDAMFAFDGRLREGDSLNVWSRLEVGDTSKFKACVDSAAEGPIDNDLSDARELGLMSTPMTFFGYGAGPGVMKLVSHVKGAKDYVVFSTEIRKLLDSNRR